MPPDQENSESSTYRDAKPSSRAMIVYATKSSGPFANLPSLDETFQIWRRVLFSPSVQTFREQKINGNFLTAIVWMFGVGLVQAGLMLLVVIGLLALVAIFLMIFVPEINTLNISPQFAIMLGALMILGLMLNIVYVIFMAPTVLIVISAILFLLARLFGGRGDFEEQTYLIATFYAPTQLAKQILFFVPFLGGLAALGLLIYQIILARFAVQVTHNLADKQAWYVILIPVGIVISGGGLLVCTWLTLMLGQVYFMGG